MIEIRETLTINGCWWWYGINFCLTILIFAIGFRLKKVNIGEKVQGLLDFGKYAFLSSIFFAVECLAALLNVENLGEEIKIGSYSFSDGNMFVTFSIFWQCVIFTALISLLVCYLIDLKRAARSQSL